MNAFCSFRPLKNGLELLELPMTTMSKRKLKAEPRLDTATCAVWAEVIAQAAQQQKALASGERLDSF